MASAAAKRQPEAQNDGTAIGLAQIAESAECSGTGEKYMVPAQEACRSPGEDKCPAGHSSEPELQEEAMKLGEEGLNPEVEAGEERGPRPTASIVRPSHGPKRKPIKPLAPGLAIPALPGPNHHAQTRVEAELPPGGLLQREEPEGSHSESSLPAKQHKKAKKRKTGGASVPPAVASTAPVPTETLGLERKAQRLRPLYQYINYCNPELNQAEEGDRETEAEPESELAPVPEEAGVERTQLQSLLPVAEEVGEESGGLSSLRVSGSLKAEVDKTTQVDIDKMLSVCAAPLVPPLSPQYK